MDRTRRGWRDFVVAVTVGASGCAAGDDVPHPHPSGTVDSDLPADTDGSLDTDVVDTDARDTAGGPGGDSGRDTSVPVVSVLPVDTLWGGTWLGFDDFYRYVYDLAEGLGAMRAGADDCTMPDGRAFHRVWTTKGPGIAAETRFFDPTTGALVAGSVQNLSSWFTLRPRVWYGEDLRDCSQRTPPTLPRTICDTCGAHPGCTAFTLPPYDTQPILASVPSTAMVPGCPGRCGDRIVQPEESCDDGNLTDADGCSATCVAETCGDGAIEPRLESCDDHNTADGDGCSHLCRVEGCGDGLLQPSLGEQCDDGNTTTDDGCDDRCTLRLTGLVNTKTAICGLAADGTPACFGSERAVLSTVPDTRFVRLVSGMETVCGIDASRAVNCWGNRARPYAYTPPPGFGPVLDYAPSTPYIDALDLRGDRLEWWTPTPTTTAGNWSRIEASVNGGCAFDDRTGRVSCFPCPGGNCDSPAGTRLVAFDEWMGTDLGIREDGTLVGWGRNDTGQNRVPTGTYTQVVASYWTACALSSVGRAVCWGDPATNPGASPAGLVLTEITMLDGAFGGVSACGVTSDGRVGCWGPVAGTIGAPAFPP